MNRAAVADLLRVPVAAYPTFTATEDVVGVWAAALDQYAGDVVRAVMGAWVQSEDDPPTIHAIVEGCRAEVRRRGEKNRLRPIGEGGPPNRDRARGTLALLREAVDRAAAGDPYTGPELVAEARQRGLTVTDGLRRCACDNGFVNRTDGTVEPCSRCNDGTRDRWLAGSYRGVEGQIR